MKIAKQLDQIFEDTNTAFDNQQFDLINEELMGINVDNEPTGILVGWLTACLSSYSKLPYIDRFYEKIEEKLKKTESEERVKALLSGLSPSRKRWEYSYLHWQNYEYD